MKSRQHGVAILSAMITVTLVASLAAAALWQQWRSVEIEKAERNRMQANWLLTGALDWARLALREDGRNNTTDHLGEPWAVPLQEARLSSFLAAEQGQTDTTNLTDSTFLSGQIIDLQSRLNVRNLSLVDEEGQAALQAFGRLFTLLDLPRAELTLLHTKLRSALVASGSMEKRDFDAGAQAAPLMPHTAEQLGWLGLSPRSIARLRPFITLLPVPNTAINLNTAPPEVLYAAIPDLSMADAQRMVSARSKSHFRSLEDASQAMGANKSPLLTKLHSLKSNFFEIQARLRMDHMTLEERSVVQRENTRVIPLWRHRGVLPPDPLSTMASESPRP